MKSVKTLVLAALLMTSYSTFAQERPLHEVHSMMVFNFIKYVQRYRRNLYRLPSARFTDATVLAIGSVHRERNVLIVIVAAHSVNQS